MLKKVVSTSQKLARLKSDSARLLYTWLLPHLDVEGRFSADPDVVKGYVVPRLKMTPKQVAQYLQEMADVGLIQIYQVNGDLFLEYAKFKDYQTLRKKREAESIIPKPNSRITPSALLELSGRTPAQDKLSKDKLSKVKESKENYAEFVRLTKQEYETLISKYGEGITEKMIDILDNYKGSKGREYKSDYRAILSWVVDKVQAQETKNKVEPEESEAYKRFKEARERKDS